MSSVRSEQHVEAALWRLARAQASPGGFLRAVAAVGSGDAAAKALALAFFALAARLLPPEQFGALRYAIATGAVGTVVVAPLTLAMMWFLADGRRQPAELPRRAATASWLTLGVALLSSAATAALFAALGKDWPAIALVGLGLSGSYYYLYYAKGSQAFARAGLFPVLSNVVQLGLASAALLAAGLRTALWMALAYAGSYWLAILLCERGAPIGLRLRVAVPDPRLARAMLRFALPLVLRHGAYTVLFALDLILLEQLGSPGELALYSATKTLATAFVIVPNAVFGVLMPCTAAGSARGFSGPFWLASLASLLASLALVLVFAAFSAPLLGLVFGPGYEGARASLLPVGLGMTLYALLLPTDAVLSGRGRLDVLGYTMLLGLAVAGLCGLWLIPSQGQYGAGLAFLVGVAAAALGLFGYAIVVERRRSRGRG